MKSNIVIFGSSRSGKTTLAKIISKKFRYNYTSIDRIVSAFQFGMPDLNINHNDRSGKTVKLLSPFLLNYIKSLDSSSLKKDGIFYVIEGSYLDLDNYLKILKKRNLKLIILLQTQLNQNQFFVNIRKYDSSNEWTAQMSDKELIDYCDNLVQFNQSMKNYCDYNNINYYDVSYNRDEIFDKIVNEVGNLEDE